jgi:hypothetical protein
MRPVRMLRGCLPDGRDQAAEAQDGHLFDLLPSTGKCPDGYRNQKLRRDGQRRQRRRQRMPDACPWRFAGLADRELENPV